MKTKHFQAVSDLTYIITWKDRENMWNFLKYFNLLSIFVENLENLEKFERNKKFSEYLKKFDLNFLKNLKIY